MRRLVQILPSYDQIVKESAHISGSLLFPVYIHNDLLRELRILRIKLLMCISVIMMQFYFNLSCLNIVV